MTKGEKELYEELQEYWSQFSLAEMVWMQGEQNGCEEQEI